MRLSIALCTVFLVSMVFTSPLYAEQFSIRIVDGLGRPLQDVSVYLYQGDKDQIYYVFSEGKDGYYYGDVDATALNDGFQHWTWELRKSGFHGYNMSFMGTPRRQRELVLKRTVPDTSKLSSLEGKQLNDLILEILTSDIIWGYNTDLFKVNDHIAPALRSALDNPRASLYAMYVLCQFANPEDLRLMASKVLRSMEKLSLELNIYAMLAGALIAPSSPEEWEFLKKSLTDKKEEWQASHDALVALAANGSKQALAILKDVPLDPQTRVHFIELNRRGLKSYPDIKDSIKDASALFVKKGEEKYFRLRQIILDRREEKAFVDCDIYYGPLIGKGYDLVFHKIGGNWVLRGMWLSRIY